MKLAIILMADMLLVIALVLANATYKPARTADAKHKTQAGVMPRFANDAFVAKLSGHNTLKWRRATTMVALSATLLIMLLYYAPDTRIQALQAIAQRAVDWLPGLSPSRLKPSASLSVLSMAISIIALIVYITTRKKYPSLLAKRIWPLYGVLSLTTAVSIVGSELYKLPASVAILANATLLISIVAIQGGAITSILSAGRSMAEIVLYYLSNLRIVTEWITVAAQLLWRALTAIPRWLAHAAHQLEVIADNLQSRDKGETKAGKILREEDEREGAER